LTEITTRMTEHQRAVFLDRYAFNGETDPSQMWRRVAEAISDSGAERDEFYRIMEDFKFVPGGRILAGAGTGNQVTFYNCYVIPVEPRIRRDRRNIKPIAFTMKLSTKGGVAVLQDDERTDHGCDSREAIFDTIGCMVDIMSRGGGVGINWSVLRPAGAHLSKVNGTSSGPIGWMDVASKAVGEVEQGGSRRGAAMFMLDDWHPSVVEFINAKRDQSKLTNCNISVAVSDAFMRAVRDNTGWALRFPDTKDSDYDALWDGDLDKWIETGHGVITYDTMDARAMWRDITDAAWASGEPGVVFMERYNRKSTGRDVERLVSVNPCGEQGLGAYSVCNLGSMNLDAYIKPDKLVVKVERHDEPTDYRRHFDWDAFKVDIASAVWFLDTAIDKNFYFLPDNERQQMRLRRIGLGVMGLADALIALGLRYGSPKAVEFTEKVFRTMKYEAIKASNGLAQVVGAAEAWDDDMLSRPYFDDIDAALRDDIAEWGLRNLFFLTQAPTGTTSILANVNSGIEPLFALRWTRTDRMGTHDVLAPAIAKWTVPSPIIEDYIVTASDVSVEEHIAMQAAVQKYVDSSVSKTINAPKAQTREECAKAYQLAYDSGLKGLAYYRDGSRDVQVLNRTEETDDTDERIRKYQDENKVLREQLENVLGELMDIGMEFERPAVLRGSTVKVRTSAGTAYVTVNTTDDGKAAEVFITVGKAGTDVSNLAEAMGRLVSLALRHGATIGGIANQLEGIGGYGNFNSSVPHAIGKVMSELNKDSVHATGAIVPEAMIPEERKAVRAKPAVKSQEKTGQLCPNCNQFSLIREEGCSKCSNCSHSAC